MKEEVSHHFLPVSVSTFSITTHCLCAGLPAFWAASVPGHSCSC